MAIFSLNLSMGAGIGFCGVAIPKVVSLKGESAVILCMISVDTMCSFHLNFRWVALPKGASAKARI